MMVVIDMLEKLNEDYVKEHLIRKPIKRGAIAGVLLLSIYFMILTVANSFAHAIEQFAYMWHWMALLVFGFSVQVGLYTYIKEASRLKSESGVSSSSIAATGGMSTTSMIACCAHHITDIMPILGLSAAALLLAQYQIPFIVLGILSNLIGITIMLKIIQENGLYQENKGLLSNIMRFHMKDVLYFTIVFSAIAFLITLSISV